MKLLATILLLASLQAHASLRSDIIASLPPGYVQIKPTTILYYHPEIADVQLRWNTTPSRTSPHRQLLYQVSQPVCFEVVHVYTRYYVQEYGEKFDSYQDCGFSLYTADQFRLPNGSWSSGMDISALLIFVPQP